MIMSLEAQVVAGIGVLILELILVGLLLAIGFKEQWGNLDSDPEEEEQAK